MAYNTTRGGKELKNNDVDVDKIKIHTITFQFYQLLIDEGRIKK